MIYFGVRLIDGHYECDACGADVRVPVDRRPQVVIVAASGAPNLRTIMPDGTEVHCCEIRTKLVNS